MPSDPFRSLPIPSLPSQVRFRFLDGEGARANPLIDELASPIDWTFVGVGSSFTHASHR